jgi:hypothetical protein
MYSILKLRSPGLSLPYVLFFTDMPSYSDKIYVGIFFKGEIILVSSHLSYHKGT